MTPEEILTDLNTNILPAVADLTNSVQTAITAMNALKDKAAVQTDKADELFSQTPADVTLQNGDIVPNFAKVRDALTAAITAFTSVAYLEANAQAVDSAKLDGKTLSTIASDIKIDIIGAAPVLLDTLEEIAAALGDDDTAINALLTQLSTLSSDLSTLSTALDGKAAAVHEHDSRYYTKAQTDALVASVDAPNPVLSTDNVEVTISGITLKASLLEYGYAKSLKRYFRYKPVGGSYIETTHKDISAVGNFDEAITGLTPLTTYIVEAVAYDTQNNIIVSGGEKVFIAPPTITDTTTMSAWYSSGGATSAAFDSATITATGVACVSSLRHKAYFNGSGEIQSPRIVQDALENEFSGVSPSVDFSPEVLYDISLDSASTLTFTSTEDFPSSFDVIVDSGASVEKKTISPQKSYIPSSVTYGNTKAYYNNMHKLFLLDGTGSDSASSAINLTNSVGTPSFVSGGVRGTQCYSNAAANSCIWGTGYPAVGAGNTLSLSCFVTVASLSTNGQIFFGLFHNTDLHALMFAEYGGKFCIYLYNDYYAISDMPINLGQRYHLGIVASFGSTSVTYKLFIDGEEIVQYTTNSAAHMSIPTGSDIIVGANNRNGFYYATIGTKIDECSTFLNDMSLYFKEIAKQTKYSISLSQLGLSSVPSWLAKYDGQETKVYVSATDSGTLSLAASLAIASATLTRSGDIITAIWPETGVSGRALSFAFASAGGTANKISSILKRLA